MGYSAGAMLMSKYMIITPCSDEYPDFKVEEGLNFDDLSIYPHNNTSSEEYPDILDIGGEVYRKNDLLKVANEYGKYYCLQVDRHIGITYQQIKQPLRGKHENEVVLFFQDNCAR